MSKLLSFLIIFFRDPLLSLIKKAIAAKTNKKSIVIIAVVKSGTVCVILKLSLYLIKRSKKYAKPIFV
jgi:hypothetical protein